MDIKERNAKMLKIFNKALQLSDAKGKDYTGKEDSLANLRVFGFKGIIIRLFDKLYRLKNIEEAGKVEVKDESVSDTLMDIIVYSALALILLGERKSGCPEPGSVVEVDFSKNDWQDFDDPPFHGKIKLVDTSLPTKLKVKK